MSSRAELEQIELLAQAEGFFFSSLLFSLLRLGVLQEIGREGASLQALAERLGAPAENMARLLNAAVTLRLLESQDGRFFRLSPRVESLLLPQAGDAYLGDWIANLRYFEEALFHLDQAVLGHRPALDLSGDLFQSPEQTRRFSLAMHNYARLRGRELANFLDLADAETLLDLGSGPGTYAFQLGLQHPHLKLFLLDSAGVLEVAREIAGSYALPNEIVYLPLDVLQDDIPGTYDTILISNTLHMLGEQQSRQLLGRAYRHLNPGGSIVVQAQYLRDDKLGSRWPVLLDLVMLCTTRTGRNHSVAETLEWLAEAGFEKAHHQAMSLTNTNSYIQAFRPRDEREARSTLCPEGRQ